MKRIVVDPRALLLALLTGCGIETTFVPLNAPPHAMPARSPESVEVFSSAPPSRPHVDVGVLEIVEETGGSAYGTAEMLEKLREAAAERGCDAIHMSGLVNKGAGVDILFNDYATDRQGVVATCIAYTDTQAASVGAGRASATALK